MAIPDDIDSCITLELASEATTTNNFRKVVVAFDGLLEAMTKAACSDGSTLKWIVRAKSGSILLGVNPDPGASELDVARVQNAFTKALAGRASSHQYERIVPHIHAISKIPNAHLWVGKECTAVTDNLYSQLKDVLRPSHTIRGSVEGRLTTLSEQRGVAIRELVWDTRIECSVPDNMLESMRYLWRKRVTARGVVHYRSDGFPTKIEADSIDAFSDDADLPTHHDVLGSLRPD